MAKKTTVMRIAPPKNDRKAQDKWRKQQMNKHNALQSAFSKR